MDTIRYAESTTNSVGTSEAYSSDAVTPAAWILANTSNIKVGTSIMQMPARTPAMAADALFLVQVQETPASLWPAVPGRASTAHLLISM